MASVDDFIGVTADGKDGNRMVICTFLLVILREVFKLIGIA